MSIKGFNCTDKEAATPETYGSQQHLLEEKLVHLSDTHTSIHEFGVLRSMVLFDIFYFLLASNDVLLSRTVSSMRLFGYYTLCPS